MRRSIAFWRRALVVFGLAAVVTGGLVRITPPIYRSETLILYQEAIRSSDVTSAEGGGENARRVGARLREALMSRASLEPIVTEMHLFMRPGADRHDLVDAVEELRSRITFKAREGDTFAIAFDGTSPSQSQEVTRLLGERIVEYAATRRAAHAQTLKEFLDAESERNQVTLKTREGAFAQFLAVHPEYAVAAAMDGSAQRAPIAGQRGSMQGTQPASEPASDATLAALEYRASLIERQLKSPDESPGPKAAPARPPTPPVDGPEVVAARKDLTEKLLKYTDKHPDVVAARTRLVAAEAAQARSRAEAETAASLAETSNSLAPAPIEHNDRVTLVRRLMSLRADIAARRARGAAPATTASNVEHGAVASEVEFRRLQREVVEARERQHQLDDKQFKASITASLVADDRNIQVSVLDPAYLPTHPISRSRRLIAAGGGLLGIVLALLVALISARLDDRLYERVDIAALDILPVLGVIPAPLVLNRGNQRRTRRGREHP